jgi:hypothetical protein
MFAVLKTAVVRYELTQHTCFIEGSRYRVYGMGHIARTGETRMEKKIAVYCRTYPRIAKQRKDDCGIGCRTEYIPYTLAM